MPLPELQMPQTGNMAAKILSGITMQDKIKADNNSAALKLMEIQNKALSEKNKALSEKNKQSIEMNDYALNLLSGVNSDEDLEIAKRQFAARYPEQSDQVNELLPMYHPRAVELIRNSLRTESDRLRMEEVKGFAPGSMLMKGDEVMGTVPFKPKEAPNPTYDVFEGPDGDQIYVAKGSKIPEGYKQVKGSGVTINTGDLGKSTQNKLEQDIIEADKNIQSFNETRKSFKDDYLTYLGKGMRKIAEMMDKSGISTEDQRKYINDYNTWFRQAKADFIAYRKWATGVAGGEKELKEIATSFPDPVNNSPEQYKANLDSIEETTRRVLELNRDYLQLGIKYGKQKPAAKSKPAGGNIIIRFDSEGNMIE